MSAKPGKNEWIWWQPQRNPQYVIPISFRLIISRTAQGRDSVRMGAPIGNGMCSIEWSRDWWRHVTQKGQSRDLVIFRCKYLEKGLMTSSMTSRWRDPNNRKNVSDFLYALHSNFSSILTCFKDIGTFVLQHATFSHPISSLPKISPRFLGVCGWSLGYEEQRCWANCSRN